MLGDIESDLSAFHRVDDMWSMDVARFWLLTNRLPAYGGAVAARMTAQQQEGTAPPMTAQPAPTQGPVSPSGARVVGATAAELRMSEIGDMFSFGSSGG